MDAAVIRLARRGEVKASDGPRCDARGRDTNGGTVDG